MDKLGPRSDKRSQFQIETDEIDEYREELRPYKTSGSFENHPPPMIIETYLDASRLSSNQSLVVVDDGGKRWDVLEALNSSDSSSDDGRSRGQRPQKRNTEVVLERWRVELKCIPSLDPDEFGLTLPTIYKKCIVFFRSLFVATRIMPCWKYSQQALAKGIHPALEVKCRILAAEPSNSCDLLRQPLYDGRDVVTDYVFGDLEVPVGRFYASVTYRNDCSFRVDDSESLLSSRFMGVDENFFKPSITQRREHVRADSYAEPGSLPSQRQTQTRGAQEPQQTYGSLSTFHGAGALGTSPISALKAVRPIGSDTSSPSGSTGASLEQSEPSHSLPIRGSANRPSLRNVDGAGRRPSISFQPFKAGSLSGSPRVPDGEAPASPQSYTRPSGLSGAANRPGTRSSLTAGMASSLRGGPPTAPQDVPQVAGSPKPTSRYSSSFTHRRGRPSFGGQSKGDDDQGSSGKQSLSSSAQPGSGLLADPGAASSGSFATDDDNISEFLKALDSRKTLQSFEPNKKGESSMAKKTAAQLSKFQQMRETNNVLTESITSSMHLQRSSGASSRQLANVPSMVNPASMSASSSPGKPLSPHTPHTPAIPSRLSENSIIDYPGQGQPPHRQQRGHAIVTTEEEGEDDTPVSQGGTTAIDIPLSPRLLHTTETNRRSSSVAQQRRSASGGDDSDIVQRSISLGADEREAPTMSTLLSYQRNSAANSDGSLGLQPAADIRASGPASPNTEQEDKGSGSASPSLLSGTPFRGVRYTGRSRPTPPHSSRGSFSGGRFAGGLARPGGGEDGADDEPLLFAMSELERPSRRSIEEGRGGGSAGSSAGPERPGFEPRGLSRRGW